MMKLTVFCVVLSIGFVAADVREIKPPVPIISQESNLEHDGTFHYSFESGDGTKAVQDGSLRVFDAEHAGEAVHGQFSYTGDDGQEYSIQYTADENGYQPQGAHIPTPPPVPEPIARALAYLATAPPPKDEKHL